MAKINKPEPIDGDAFMLSMKFNDYLRAKHHHENPDLSEIELFNYPFNMMENDKERYTTLLDVYVNGYMQAKNEFSD